MHSTRVLSLFTALITIAIQMNPVAAKCCPCPTTLKCGDGTKCTPYCGRGRCNIFGCNCDGGCRSRTGFVTLDIDFGDASESYFDDADANKDGKLTYEEWAATDQNKGVDPDVLKKQWAKYDSSGVGHLTKVQAVSRTA